MRKKVTKGFKVTTRCLSIILPLAHNEPFNNESLSDAWAAGAGQNSFLCGLIKCGVERRKQILSRALHNIVSGHSLSQGAYEGDAQ